MKRRFNEKKFGKLAKEAGRKVIPAANGCSIHDMYDCWIVTNKNGLNIGQCRTLIEAEHIAENADEYTAKKLGYSESKKLVKEGAGAGYTVHIKDLKFGNILEKKYIKMKKDYESYWECQVEIKPGEYEIAAEDYYNDYFWQEHEFGDTPTAKIDGGVATIAYSTNSYDEDEADDELRHEVAGRTLDISFDYGWGWVHVDLPREKIEADHVDADGEFYGSIDKIELNAPDLADAVNGGFQSIYDQDEDEKEEEVDESRYMSDDDISGQYKDWWFSEFGPVEDDGDRLEASAWIEFPSADGEDFDSGRGLWFVKDLDEDDYPRELNDVWMEAETEKEVKNAARLLMNAKVKYLSFNSAEEFHKYMDEFKKGSMVNEVSGWDLEDEDLTLVNDESDGDKLYIVKLWWGSGYMMDCYNAYANSDEEALNYVVAYIEKHDPKLLETTDQHANDLMDEIEQDHISATEMRLDDDFYPEDTPEFQEAFIWVDATMEGASKGHYVWSENLTIAEYPKEHNYPLAKGVKRMNESYGYGKDDGKKKVMDALEEFRQVLWEDTYDEDHDLRRAWFERTDKEISNAVQKYFKYTRI